MSVTVRYAVLPPQRIVNLTSPRYLPEVSREWQGKHDWHDARYEPVRDLMERLYVEGFNAASGHYERLETSVRRDGFRNPVMVSAGRLGRREPAEIPPDRRGYDVIACEYLGGSRLWVAERLGLDVPCIVNDHTGVLPDAAVLPGLVSVLEYFTDTPARAEFGPNGVYINNLPYMHLPEAERYEVAEQSRIRRGIVNGIKESVQRWLDAHDE